MVLRQQGKGLESTQNELYALGSEALKKTEWKKWVEASGLINFDTIIRSLKLELDSKAWAKDHKHTQQGLQMLQRDFKPMAMKATLAADFVDWYSKKGEAFEGNLNTLDRHLERLVVDGRVVD